ncbi:MAG: glycoside hydrolase family 99-like domain-containing protein [Candidatus Omnitrophica bacterium]|nr:glycoside hydrolase family 99-like domain-containing protein [Candidatus Omnitrophota bacterium]
MNTVVRKRVRLIAFYLPQFYPIPENDEWWGKDFTEWTNVKKAQPLFKGHYQPRVPADLGYYSLLDPGVREAQADLAKEYGVYAFCYYHYWFSGKRLLERPFNEVLRSGRPDFPFCLCWANGSWGGAWQGDRDRILIEQRYSKDDHKNHFYALLEAFNDERYITIDGKKVFVVHLPADLPDTRVFSELWQELALKSGLRGFYFVGVLQNNTWQHPEQYGFDAFIVNPISLIGRFDLSTYPASMYNKLRGKHVQHMDIKRFTLPFKVNYGFFTKCLDFFGKIGPGEYPCVIPNWDNTPRCGRHGYVLHDSTPELFRKHLKRAIERVSHREIEHRLVFIKSWNEWGEGNYLEPDERFGRGYLKAMKEDGSGI